MTTVPSGMKMAKSGFFDFVMTTPEGKEQEAIRCPICGRWVCKKCGEHIL